MLGKSPDRRSPVDMGLVKNQPTSPPCSSDPTPQPTLFQDKSIPPSEGVLSDSVLPDSSNLVHRALVSMLGDMIIPVYPGTTKVDFARVRRTIFPGAPEFRLNSLLVSNLPREQMALSLLRLYTDFMETFREFYYQNLSSVLFDRLAWSYMYEALKSNRTLATQYDQAIRHYQHDQRDWHHIARCLEKILKLRFFRFELMKQLIAVKPEPHEDSIAYADRLQQLVKLSRADREGTERFTISVIAESLPDGGYERVKAYFGSEDSIRTVHDIVQFIRKTPGTLSGRTTDRAEWVWKHFRQAEPEEQQQDLEESGVYAEQDPEPLQDMQQQQPQSRNYSTPEKQQELRVHPTQEQQQQQQPRTHPLEEQQQQSRSYPTQEEQQQSRTHPIHEEQQQSRPHPIEQQQQQQEAFEKYLHQQQQQQSSVRAEETERPRKRRRSADLCTEEECIQRNAFHRPEVCWVRYPHLHYDRRHESTRPPRREESASSTSRAPRHEESTSSANARCTEDACVRKRLKHRQSECWIRNPHLRRERPSRATAYSNNNNNNNNTYTTTTSNLVDFSSTSNSTCHSPLSYADEATDAWCPEEECFNRNLKHRADQCWIRHPHLRVSRSKKPARGSGGAAADTIRTVRFEDPNCGEDECLQNHIVHRPDECWVRYRDVDPDLDHIVY